MSRKTKTQQTQNYNNTNSYGWQTMPSTADIDALRNFKFDEDPAIGFNFAAARNRLSSSFDNPLGGYYSPQMRDAIVRSGQSELSQQEAQAKSEAYSQLQGARFGQKATVAGLTAPRLTQTGSTGQSSGTGVQSSSMLPDLLVGIASGAASGAAA